MPDIDVAQQSEKRTTEAKSEPSVQSASSIATPPTMVRATQPSTKKAELTPTKTPAAKTLPTKQETSVNEIYALVVDDEPANRDFLERLLAQTKLAVNGASEPNAALEIVETLGDKIKLIMLDRQLPGISGVELLKQLREKLPTAKIVMATMHDDRAMIEEAFAVGCNAFLVKPNGFMELFHMIKDVCDDLSCLDKLDNLIFDHHGSRPWRA
jgi:CheY-like chemotaxis protein